MSGILFIGPRKGENEHDHFIRMVNTTFHGNEETKGFSHLELVLTAFRQLDDSPERPEHKFDENGIRTVSMLYNLPQSINHDLELNGYTNIPKFYDFFCAIDKFGILGKIGDARAGFMIDCFANSPTRTSTFLQTPLEEDVRKFVLEIFNLTNSSGNSAYSERGLKRGSFELSQYGISIPDCEISDGELRFGGEGKTYPDMVKGIMESSNKCLIFTPEQYFLSHYEFKIDPKKMKGSEEQIREMFSDLKTRHTRLYEEKARRIAA